MARPGAGYIFSVHDCGTLDAPRANGPWLSIGFGMGASQGHLAGTKRYHRIIAVMSLYGTNQYDTG